MFCSGWKTRLLRKSCLVRGRGEQGGGAESKSWPGFVLQSTSLIVAEKRGGDRVLPSQREGEENHGFGLCLGQAELLGHLP